ncbi:hypothetical protein KM043_005759 [Ampulex compressa]|nr:hypothetical protein KM043_005759 [Ampulex compressa]
MWVRDRKEMTRPKARKRSTPPPALICLSIPVPFSLYDTTIVAPPYIAHRLFVFLPAWVAAVHGVRVKRPPPTERTSLPPPRGRHALSTDNRPNLRRSHWRLFVAPGPLMDLRGKCASADAEFQPAFAWTSLNDRLDVPR